MFKKIVLTVSVVVAVLGVSHNIAPQRVVAQTSQYEYFCHRSNSASNPYQKKKFTPGYDEVDGIGRDDHSSHTGPVFDVLVHSQENRGWGDIIPPVPGLPTGLNWDSAGQAIYYAQEGCGNNYQSESEAELYFSVDCSEDNLSVVVTVYNIGGKDGEVLINDTESLISVPGFGSIERVFNLGVRIVINIDDEEVYNDTPVCSTEDPELPVGGRGSGTVTPAAETAAPAFSAAVLPQTSATNYALIIGAFSAATALLSVVTKKLYTKFF